MHQFEFLQITNRNRRLFNIIKDTQDRPILDSFQKCLRMFLVILIFASPLLKTFPTVVTLQVPGEISDPKVRN